MRPSTRCEEGGGGQALGIGGFACWPLDLTAAML